MTQTASQLRISEDRIASSGAPAAPVESYRFRRGEIIAFRFPRREGAALRARPCLVLEADDSTILLAYGTTSKGLANRGHDLPVQEDHACAGLDRPTRFVCARRIRVTPADPRIVPCPKGGAPILGRLPETHMAELGAILRAIVAESPDADLRHRQERAGIHPHGARGRDAGSGRPEVVVRRRLRTPLNRRGRAARATESCNA